MPVLNGVEHHRRRKAVEEVQNLQRRKAAGARVRSEYRVGAIARFERSFDAWRVLRHVFGIEHAADAADVLPDLPAEFAGIKVPPSVCAEPCKRNVEIGTVPHVIGSRQISVRHKVAEARLERSQMRKPAFDRGRGKPVRKAAGDEPLRRSNNLRPAKPPPTLPESSHTGEKSGNGDR